MRRKSSQNSHLNGYVATLAGSLLLVSACAEAKWTITPSISTNIDAYKRNFDDGTAYKNEIFTIKPSLLAAVDTRKLKGSLAIKRQQVIPHNTENVKHEGFNDLALQSTFSFIPNTLTLKIQANQNYHVINLEDRLSSDLLVNPGNFSKLTSGSAELAFATPNAHYFGLSSQIKYSKTKSDSNDQQSSQTSSYYNYDNNMQLASIRLFQGNRLKAVSWNVQASHQKTSRQVQGDFTADSVRAKLSVAVYKQLRLVATGKNEKNQVDSGFSQLANGLGESSYGAGLEWHESENRFITLTYNNLSPRGQDSSQQYVGGEINWAFTERTKIDANFDKRFYGNAYHLTMVYAIRHIRAQATYSENVTNSAQVSNSIQPGILVCPQGNQISVGDCFQPDIGYQLQPGEQVYNTEQFIQDISNEVILRKSASGSLSWAGRRLTLALGANITKSHYLETSRYRDDRNATLSSTYALGRSLKTNASLSYAKNDYFHVAEPNTTKTATIGFTQQLGRNLNWNGNIKYISRNSVEASRGLTDRRISFGMTYKFN